MNSAARGIIASTLHLPCWQVRWDNQVGLDMNFGWPSMELVDRAPLPRAPQGSRRSVPSRSLYLKGSHWLCVSPWWWRLELAEGVRVRSSSSTKAQDMACARLAGEKLVRVEINGRTGMTTFRFDLGGTLTVSARGPVDDDTDELWTLHARGRYVAVHADGQYETGSTRTARNRRLPISADRGAIVIESALRRRVRGRG